MATSQQLPESSLPTEEIKTEKVTTDMEINGKGEEKNEKTPCKLINFNILFYLNNIYRTHGFIDEEFSRFLSYVKKRRKKLKSKVLPNIKKVDRRVMKIYPLHIENEKYLELLILEVEYCRCKYLKIKTDVNNLKISYRAKYHYLNRLKKSLQKIQFLNNAIKNGVDKNTELQVQFFTAFVECSYFLEKKMFKECLEKIQSFFKLAKLIKRAIMNLKIESKTLHEKKTDTEAKKSNETKDLLILNKNEQFIDIEEQQKIDDMFEYYIGIINGYKRVCEYNLKKIGKSRSREKLEEDDFSKEIKDYIKEEPINNTQNLLQIHIQDTEVIISIKDSKFTLHELDMSIVKIKNIMDDIKPVIKTEDIELLDVPSDLQNISKNYEMIFNFLNKFEINFILYNYGNLFTKNFNCLSIMHEELIKSTNKKTKTSEYDKVAEKIWNMLESYFLTENFYLDIERALLILLKSLCNIYENKTETKKEGVNEKEKNNTQKKGKTKKKEHEKENSSEITSEFKNKHTLHDLINAFPLLNEGIRYADILKQNVDGLKNIENSDLLVNMLQIIKNVKALCSAFYYILVKRNAEAHVLFDQVKTRNYVYLKFKKGEINTSLLRISILFNRLQDILYLVNEKYYFRHLSFYSLILKKKVSPANSLLYYADKSLFVPQMNQVYLNPMYVDMAYMYNSESFLTGSLQKERGTGIRGLIKSFWKK